jgi:hypothetical protein
MKKEIHPLALVAVILVLVVGIAVFGYRSLQPAPYTPSPGAGGTGGAMAGQPPGAAKQTAPAQDTSSYYPSAPPGSIPGKPVGNGQ